MTVTHSLDLEASSSQYASIADGSQSGLDLSGDLSIEAWVKLESTPGSSVNYVIASKSNSDTSQRSYSFDYYNSGTNIQLRLLLSPNGSAFTVIPDWIITLPLGVWIHLAVTHNATTGIASFYMNGELLGTDTGLTGTLHNSSASFIVGAYGNNTPIAHWDGLIRNVRVWNDVRSLNEIRVNMNVDTPSETTGLVSNYIFNNDYTDSHGNNDLTASGSPVFTTVYPDALALTENLVYTKKHKIVVQHGQVAGSADLTDVPIVLTESNFLADAFNNTLNGGADLRFSMDIDGKIRLAHEVVSWDTSGDTGEVWVKINTLDHDNDTDIYVHYGNASAVAINENEAFGKHQVWGENWRGVYHLNESSGSRFDATRRSNDLGDTNTVLSGAGKLGTAADYEATNNEYNSLANGSDNGLEMTGSQTWLAWVKPESLANNKRFVAKARNDFGDYRLLYQLADGTLLFFITGLTTNTLVGFGAGTLTTGTWQHLVGRYDSSAQTLAIFHNLTKASVTASGSANAVTAAGQFAIGSDGVSGHQDGMIDQVMIYNGALSDDYIATLYNNQNSPSTFAMPSEISNGNFFHLLA